MLSIKGKIGMEYVKEMIKQNQPFSIENFDQTLEFNPSGKPKEISEYYAISERAYNQLIHVDSLEQDGVKVWVLIGVIVFYSTLPYESVVIPAGK